MSKTVFFFCLLQRRSSILHDPRGAMAPSNLA